ncbi:MAG: TonB-dependent receptor [Cytophagales bacterium]|nr:TonB-dependent receptor [Cytophagales bacterium]
MNRYIRYLLGVLLLTAQANAAPLQAVATLNVHPDGWGQSAGRPLQKVLQEIQRRHKVYFNFDAATVQKKTVAREVKLTDNVEENLRNVLHPLQLRFEKIGDHFYSIYPEMRDVPSPGTAPATENPNGLASMDRQSIAQPAAVAVTGTVTDEKGETLAGVAVVEKGTTNGTATSADGKYSLSVANENAVLVFSFIGYTTEEVTVGNRTTVNVTMIPDIKSLTEVVVVGYGTQVKKDVTGSIASVKAADIRDIATTSADALLQGKAAGVQVVQNSGQPGAEVFVRVRGSASLRADSRPLYVIDGVPMNNTDRVLLDGAGQRASALADINPNDIESMEVLKDAAATAIYGARASNGVILITTKRGKEGKARFNFDAYTGVQEVWRRMDLLNGQQFSEMYREALRNRLAIQPTFVDTTRGGFPEALRTTGANTDWQNEIFRTAPISSYNFSVTGGKDKLQSYVSLGYFRQQGTIIGQDYRRFNGRLNLDYQATRNLKIGTSLTYSNSVTDRVANDYSTFSVLGNALLRNPNLPVRNPDGTYSVDPRNREGTENPVMLANEITFVTNQKRLISNVYAEFEITKGLTFRSVLGMDNISDRTQRFVPSFVLNLNPAGAAQAQALTTDVFTWLNDNTLNFTRTFATNHRVSALAGFGIQRSRTDFLYAGGNTAGSDIITTVAISQPDIPGNFISEWRLLSYFGRASYSFKDRYIIEGSFRTDGSSRFGANKRFGFFPAVSVAWRAIEEPFLQSLTFMSDLKLRGGIGVTGNQEGLENFGSLTRYGTGRNYDGRPGISQANVPNPNLGWESTTTTNVGADIGFFQNRVSLSVDAYLKQTKDLLFTRQLPWTSGFSQITNVNVGSLENRGLEVALFTRNVDKAFKWTTNFNIAFNRNKITDLPVNGTAGSDLIFKLPDAFGIEGPYTIYRVGQQVGTFYGYDYLGVYRTDEEVPANLKDQTGNNASQNYRGGYPIFRDVDGNGVYDRQQDRVVIGNALPLHTGGLTNTFSYKGVELNVFMNWSYGNQIYNMTRAALTGMVDDYNQSTEVLTRWRRPGDITQIPIAMYNNSSFQAASFTDASSRYIEDGSFLRVRTVTLSYDFPTSLLNKVKLGSARLYVTGQNLLTFTNYSGLDPENQNTGGGLIPTLGVDYLTQPQPRVYMVGLNLGF